MESSLLECLQPLQSITVYESRLYILITGLCSETKRYLALQVKRTFVSPNVRHRMELHAKSYSLPEIESLAASLKCVSIISNAFCIFGCIELVESSYIIIVTKATVIAAIHGHQVYTISETNLLPIIYKVRNTMEESRYKSILTNFDLANRGFYFSYTFDLTKSIQQNITDTNHSNDDDSDDDSDSVKENQNNRHDKFIWNHFALMLFRKYYSDNIPRPENLVNSKTNRENSNFPIQSKDIQEERVCMNRWIVPVTHGYMKQKTFASISGDIFKYTLIARRSRIFAGTRYLRRGVDINGFTANEVETEQIITREKGLNCSYRSSSLVQIRGSIPLYWYHVNLFIPSPDIKINESDYGYNAAYQHFDMLKESFGDRITILNLVRLQNSGRETRIGRAFKELILALNDHYKQLKQLIGDSKEGKEGKEIYEGKEGSEGKERNGGTDGTEGRRSSEINDIEKFFDSNNEKSQRDDSENENETQNKQYMQNMENKEKLNNLNSVKYIAFDFHGCPHSTLFSKLGLICEEIFANSGFFVQACDDNEDDKDDEEFEGAMNMSDLCGVGKRCSIGNEEGNLVDNGRCNVNTVSDENGPNDANGPNDVGCGDGNRTDRVAAPLYVIWPPNDLNITSKNIPKNSDNFQMNFENDSTISETVPNLNPNNVKETSSDSESLGNGVRTGVLQKGVLRTNCVDCLDRTNVAQFCYARHSLYYQFKAVGSFYFI